MESIFLSIIIPFYNTDSILFKKCIESIHSIKIPIEILIVNDGSQEGYNMETCLKYTAFDQRIRWIHKKNGGVSTARNRGIEEAKGTYLLFVDADDEISENFVAFINHQYKKISAEWVLFDLKVRDLEKQEIRTRTLFSKENTAPVEDSEIYDMNLQDVLNLRVSTKELSECWAKLILRDTVVKYGIKFPDDVLSGEDAIFNTRLLTVINSIQYVPMEAYIYNYLPRMGERLLKNPYKRYEYLTLGKDTLDAFIEKKAKEENKSAYFIKNKVYLIEVVVQDCLILQNAHRLTQEMKRYLEKWIDENRIVESVSLQDCHGLKSKIYYIIVKYKIWMGIKIIHSIKYKSLVRRKT